MVSFEKLKPDATQEVQTSDAKMPRISSAFAARGDETCYHRNGRCTWHQDINMGIVRDGEAENLQMESR
jgi:hypothetical protein